MSLIALDIGGANIKAADGRGNCVHLPFQIWKQKNDLPVALAELIHEMPSYSTVVVTMTAELADCFTTKQEGVEFVVDSVVKSFTEPICVYLVNDRFVTPETAVNEFMLAAASNWYGLAKYAGRFGSENTVLLDIGSTTTDVIPLKNGEVAARGKSDHQRLVNCELIYTGIDRSSISGIMTHAVHRGQTCPLMNEMFATTLDAYTVLGLLGEDASNTCTANGRPQTKNNCIARLARMFGKDETDFFEEDAIDFARQIQQAQIELIQGAVTDVTNRFREGEICVVVSGQGEFLAHDVINRICRDDLPAFHVVSLNKHLGKTVSKCASAHALAVLAREQFHSEFDRDRFCELRT